MAPSRRPRIESTALDESVAGPSSLQHCEHKIIITHLPVFPQFSLSAHVGHFGTFLTLTNEGHGGPNFMTSILVRDFPSFSAFLPKSEYKSRGGRMRQSKFSGRSVTAKVCGLKVNMNVIKSKNLKVPYVY